MNWNVVASTGEWAGAIAVVATLFYLARQIRQNSVQIRLNSSQLATNEYSGRIVDVLQDATKLKVFRDGLDDYSSLGKDQQALFHSIMLGFLLALMNSRQLVSEGVIDTDVYAGWARDYERILACPGAWEWWQAMGEMIDPALHGELSANVKESRPTPLNEVMPFLRPDAADTGDT